MGIAAVIGRPAPWSGQQLPSIAETAHSQLGGRTGEPGFLSTWRLAVTSLRTSPLGGRTLITPPPA
jgi:hypothetical protein